MNRTEKFLKKLFSQERLEVEKTIHLILSQKFVGLDIKKLKGKYNIYRVRKGKIRIVYQILGGGKVDILFLDRRNDTTYNF